MSHPPVSLPARWALSVLLLSFHSAVQAAHWPAWRGVEGIGRCVETNLPLHWSATSNVLWRVSLPERGNSTPVIWGDRVFITQAMEKEGHRTLMCFRRGSGRNDRLLWQKGVTYEKPELTHSTNPQCSASPVTDGERVIVSFGSAGVYCYDFAGQELWHRDLGEQKHIWGNAASPVLDGDLCFLNFGPGERTFLIALDKKTGQTKWERREPGGDSGEEAPGKKAVWIGSWSTPVLVNVAGKSQLLMSFPNRLAAFEPGTGVEQWTCSGLNPLVYTSPLIGSGVAVAMGGFGGSTIAVRLGGEGDVTATHRLWQHPKTKQRIGSGVISGDHIYVLDEPGVLECSELQTGRILWQERLTGRGANNASWSSLVLAGDRLYALNQSGDTFVLRADPRFEVMATNSLGSGTTLASHAMAGGEIFIRTHRDLWCIGRTPAAPQP